MKRVHNWVLSTVILASIVAFARNAAESRFPWLPELAFWIIILLFPAWVLASIAGPLLNILYFGQGRYAVLLFVLDEHDRLLLVLHPYHKRRIPPGGRLRMWELPHEAVSRILREETGIESYNFEPHFHAKVSGYTDAVTILPAPHQVQREDRKQRGLIKFHYAFVYVLRVASTSIESGPSEYQPTWHSSTEVEQMKPPDRPFDDIVRRYRDILVSMGAHQ